MSDMWKLELALLDPMGRLVTRSITTVDPYEQVPTLTPPHEFDGRTFNETVDVMKTRDKRTRFIKDAAKGLGEHMAQRLEDKEGWHGESRADTIRRQDAQN